MPPKKRRSVGTVGDGTAAPGRKARTKSRAATAARDMNGPADSSVAKSSGSLAARGGTATIAGSGASAVAGRPGADEVSADAASRKRKTSTASDIGRDKSAPSARTAKAKAAARRPKTGTIEDAIELAVRAHRGQTDKYHLPYILHVFGVAARCRTIEEKIVAFLHDTVEDTDTTLADLRRLGFTERVIEAVDKLTRRKGESYDEFVDRVAPNPLARAVKLADLEDNMDVRRSDRAMKEKDAERMEKYRKAWQKLAALVVAEKS